MKNLFTFFAVSIMFLTACANDKVIAYDKLPKDAKQFISTYFAGESVALSKMDYEGVKKNYEVVFINGGKVDFDSNGNWKDVEIATGVPAEIIPSFATNYVQANFAGQIVVQIDRDRRYYELKLSNGVELKFNKDGVLQDID
jgi:hypothetical protein